VTQRCPSSPISTSRIPSPAVARIDSFTTDAPSEDAEPRARSLREARDHFERSYILAELRANDWNMTRTAERLGIERSHLYRKIKAHGIAPPK